MEKVTLEAILSKVKPEKRAEAERAVLKAKEAWEKSTPKEKKRFAQKLHGGEIATIDWLLDRAEGIGHIYDVCAEDEFDKGYNEVDEFVFGEELDKLLAEIEEEEKDLDWRDLDWDFDEAEDVIEEAETLIRRAKSRMDEEEYAEFKAAVLKALKK